MMNVGNRMETVGLSQLQKLGTSGFKLLGLTVTAKRAHELQQEGIPAITTQRLRVAKQFWDDADANTVIAVDDAHLIDASSFMSILDRADERGARIVLLAQ